MIQFFKNSDSGKKLPGNAIEFSVESTPENENTKLKGKTIYFLGSSVTYGTASEGESFVDYLAKEDDINFIKEAVSGTTLAISDSDKILQGLDKSQVNAIKYAITDGKPEQFGKSYVERLQNMETDISPDLFIVQLSTNDSRYNCSLGEISSTKEIDTFDKTTTVGAIEYIIACINQRWGCPIAFYTFSFLHLKTEIPIWNFRFLLKYSPKSKN